MPVQAKPSPMQESEEESVAYALGGIGGQPSMANGVEGALGGNGGGSPHERLPPNHPRPHPSCSHLVQVV